MNMSNELLLLTLVEGNPAGMDRGLATVNTQDTYRTVMSTAGPYTVKL